MFIPVSFDWLHNAHNAPPASSSPALAGFGLYTSVRQSQTGMLERLRPQDSTIDSTHNTFDVVFGPSTTLECVWSDRESFELVQLITLV